MIPVGVELYTGEQNPERWDYEGKTIREEDVQSLQSNQTQRKGYGNLQEPKTQTASGIGGSKMARVAGVDIPDGKKIWVALTYIYGIGKHRSLKVLEMAGVDPEKRTKDLAEEEVAKINKVIAENYKVEGDLRKEVTMNIKRLMDIGCYRGLRHRVGLPVRGQRTRSNARTRKGPRRRIGTKKKKQQ